jgi:hypothetical protein
MCHEDILASMEEPVELGINDEDPEFLKEHLNSFSFDNVRNKGRKGCGYKEDVEVPVRQSGSVLNCIPFVSTTPTAGSRVQPVKQNLPDEKKKHSVNAIVQVMFSKTTAKLRRGFVDGTGVNL